MNLSFKKFGVGRPLVILHGLFGSADNWQTMARELSGEFSMFLVDQRNHGHSPHSQQFDYDILADDIRDFLVQHQLKDVILMGHSMGGKAAVRMAQKYPGYLSKLIVVDMGVKYYPPHHQDILAGFEAVDLKTAKSRSEAEEMMKGLVPNYSVRQFLLKNLYWKEKGQLAWRINLPVIKESMGKIGAALPVEQVNLPTLFVRGSKSNYILEEDFEPILELFPNGKIETLQVGHWVHAEDPEGLMKFIRKFVTK